MVNINILEIEFLGVHSDFRRTFLIGLGNVGLVGIGDCETFKTDETGFWITSRTRESSIYLLAKQVQDTFCQLYLCCMQYQDRNLLHFLHLKLVDIDLFLGHNIL